MKKVLIIIFIVFSVIFQYCENSDQKLIKSIQCEFGNHVSLEGKIVLVVTDNDCESCYNTLKDLKEDSIYCLIISKYPELLKEKLEKMKINIIWQVAENENIESLLMEYTNNHGPWIIRFSSKTLTILELFASYLK